MSRLLAISLLFFTSSVFSSDMKKTRCDYQGPVNQSYSIGYTNKYIVEMYGRFNNGVYKLFLMKRKTDKKVPFESCSDLDIVAQIDVSEYLSGSKEMRVSFYCEDVEYPMGDYGYRVMGLVSKEYGMEKSAKAWVADVNDKVSFREVSSPAVYCMTLPPIDADHIEIGKELGNDK